MQLLGNLNCYFFKKFPSYTLEKYLTTYNVPLANKITSLRSINEQSSLQDVSGSGGSPAMFSCPNN